MILKMSDCDKCPLKEGCPGGCEDEEDDESELVMTLSVPKHLRIGQNLYNFVYWCQHNETKDLYYMDDGEVAVEYNNYRKFYNV